MVLVSTEEGELNVEHLIEQLARRQRGCFGKVWREALEPD